MVGGMAPIKRPKGAIVFSGKWSRNIAIPAGFGALAMTVRPPPVTAPATKEILNSSDNPSTRIQGR